MSGRRGKKRPVEEKGEGTAAGILHEVGKMLGIGGLLKGVEKLPAFKERLKRIDEEIERRLGEEPLKVVEMGEPGSVGVKPGVKPPSREVEADVFDEKDYVLVVAEIPGAEEKSINLSLEKDRVTLSFEKGDRTYRKELKLPCAPQGEMTRTYKNGILEVRINKG